MFGKDDIHDMPSKRSWAVVENPDKSELVLRVVLANAGRVDPSSRVARWFCFFPSRFALSSLELVDIVAQKKRFHVRENEDIVGRHDSPTEPILLGIPYSR